MDSVGLSMEPVSDRERWFDPGAANVQLIYILYLVGMAVAFTPLVAIVLAHLNRRKTSGWIETHYTWAIHTFWLMLIYIAVACMIAMLPIGLMWAADVHWGYRPDLAVNTVMFVFGAFVLFSLLVPVIFVVRCVRGLVALGKNEPIKNPRSWTI